ncbi:MAG TPA: serine/threonine-protein kinase [Gemmatales bacterium]|nr:serine/threonine-protein kinase [Gemmatales bacterium]
MALAIAPELLLALTGLNASQLQELLAKLPPQDLLELPKLAQHLEGAGHLTAYQAGHLAEGRGEGLLVGQYVVLDELGHGSMGMVYQVRHRIMRRKAALKVFTPDSADSENYTRFMREIQATAQLDHPHLIKAYEAGEYHGAYFLAMEYVDGQNLQEKTEREGPLPVPLALQCFMEAATGLGYAHGLGMVHRDVKPGNIMLGKDGRVRVLDLGLVKFLRGISNMATSLDGSVRGTAAYMSPEQAISIRYADHRSDIYSLGSSLFFVLTGRAMFPEKTVMQQLLAHQKKPAPSLLTLNSQIPPYLDQLYLQMVAKNPDERPQSMAEVVSGLKAILQGGKPRSLQPAAPTQALPATSELKTEPRGNQTTWRNLFPFWRDKPKDS